MRMVYNEFASQGSARLQEENLSVNAHFAKAACVEKAMTGLVLIYMYIFLPLWWL